MLRGHATFFLPFFSSKPLFGPKNGPQILKKVVLGVVFEHFKNYHTLRYDIYDFLIKGFGWAMTDLFGKNPLFLVLELKVLLIFIMPSCCVYTFTAVVKHHNLA